MQGKIWRSVYRGSSRKFYQIVNEKQEELIPQSPDQFIISKYLKDQKNGYRKQKSSLNVTKKQERKSKNVNYQKIMQKSPYGSIVERQYKNLQLSLISLNFKNIQLKDVYALSQKINPDLVFVQARPQYYLPKFELLPKRYDVFSDKLYLRQLSMQPEMVKNYLLSDDLSEYFDNLVQEKEKNKDEKIYIQDTRGSIEDEVTLISSYYSAINKKSLMIGDIPEQAWREWLCNSYTLMQLQQIFKHICKNVPYYQSLNLSLEKVACMIKPEIFLNLKDKYMATLIEMLAAQCKPRKVMAFMGAMENQAVLQILENDMLLRANPKTKKQEFTPLLQYLIGPPIKSSLLRNIQGWQIIEKHLILDILKYGSNIINISLDHFTTTNKIIQHYGQIHNSYTDENIMRFRYDKITEYLDLMASQIEEGRLLRDKFMLREAIRNQSQSD